jgi:hypothetical protein
MISIVEHGSNVIMGTSLRVSGQMRGRLLILSITGDYRVLCREEFGEPLTAIELISDSVAVIATYTSLHLLTIETGDDSDLKIRFLCHLSLRFRSTCMAASHQFVAVGCEYDGISVYLVDMCALSLKFCGSDRLSYTPVSCAILTKDTIIASDRSGCVHTIAIDAAGEHMEFITKRVATAKLCQVIRTMKTVKLLQESAIREFVIAGTIEGGILAIFPLSERQFQALHPLQLALATSIGRECCESYNSINSDMIVHTFRRTPKCEAIEPKSLLLRSCTLWD